MTGAEFSNQFELLYNNITSNQAPGLNEWEKSSFLTKAQDELIKNHFLPQSNKNQTGFDDTQKRQMDFSMLMRVHGSTPVYSPYLDSSTLNDPSAYWAAPLDPRSLLYKMPEDLFIPINETLNFIEGSGLNNTGYDGISNKNLLSMHQWKKGSDYTEDVYFTKSSNSGSYELSERVADIASPAVTVTGGENYCFSFIQSAAATLYIYQAPSSCTTTKQVMDYGSYITPSMSTITVGGKTLTYAVFTASSSTPKVVINFMDPHSNTLYIYNPMLEKGNTPTGFYPPYSNKYSRQVIPLSFKEYTRIMSKPYKEPLKNQAWRLLSGNSQDALGQISSADGKLTEVVVNHNDLKWTKANEEDRNIQYIIRYIKKPKPILVSPIDSYGLTILGHDGHYTDDSDYDTAYEYNDDHTEILNPCELDESLHEEILQRAVELAKVSWQGDVQTVTQAGQRSE